MIAVSDYLRRELEAKVPQARGKTEVVDSGVDLERFRVEPAPDGGPALPLPRALTERKNVVRLADAFARLGEGTLTFVGDGPLRAAARRAPSASSSSGVVPHDEVPARIAAAHVVCQPSLIEPFGQATLEAMACGRSVVATAPAARPSSCRPRRACSSTRSTWRGWPMRSAPRRRCHARIRPPERPPRPTTCESRPSG